MKHFSTFILLFSLQLPAYAGFTDLFKDENGRTKWQHVANFSSSVLILMLLITVVFLFFAHRRARRSNRELNEIRKFLEQRVAERTAGLQHANKALEGEVAQHKATMAQLRSSQTYIKSIVDSMPLMLIGLNEKMEITQWNRWAETTTSMGPDIVMNKYLWEVYPTISLTPSHVEEVITKKNTMTIKHSQRGQYYFDITLYAIQGQGDTGVVILVDDITKRMKTENKLIQKDKVSAMGELASTMAHDINSPLQVILNTLHVVQQNIAEKSKEDALCNLQNTLSPMLANAEESGKQASAIIHNLLDFSRSPGDRKQKVNIGDVIDHSIELAQSLLSHHSGFKFRDISILRNYQENTSQIECDISELQQVFLSLFRHAFHSLSDKLSKEVFLPEIQVEVSEFYDALWVKAHHNGKGLTPEEQMDIFEPFFSNTAERTASPVEHRLSFSYFIVTEHHRGHMAVTSDLNVGTTFHIQFPLC